MDTTELHELMGAYRAAPVEFQATTYWQAYEKRMLDAVAEADFNQLRSGKYPILATFGFNDVAYFRHPNLPLLRRLRRALFHWLVAGKRWIMPYGLDVPWIQDMAYHHCELYGALTGSRPLSSIGMSRVGAPGDLFEVGGRAYSVKFLDYYLRYCFADRHLRLRGDEIVVELGSGSGYQVEILKKLFPGLTILCLDLPAPLFLCQEYLRQALGEECIVPTQQTRGWRDLSGLRRGAVHFLGNWQMPLLKGHPIDLFWNAASFGEMEPDVVQNYLSFVKGTAAWIYLLQARQGKKRVARPSRFEDYGKYLSGYTLVAEQDVFQALRRLFEDGTGYFEGVWRKA